MRANGRRSLHAVSRLGALSVAVWLASGATQPAMDRSRGPLAAGAGLLAMGDAPVVFATDAVGSPPKLRGGTIPLGAEYVLTTVAFYDLGRPGAPSGKAGTRFQERLRYAGSSWEAIFLHAGELVRWGGTWSSNGNVLTSLLTFGLRAGATLVDVYGADAQQLIVQFGAAHEPLTQLTFTRQ